MGIFINITIVQSSSKSSKYYLAVDVLVYRAKGIDLAIEFGSTYGRIY